MLSVFNGNESYAILESNYEKYEEQNGTALQISFNSYDFNENIGHEFIDFNVTIEDEDGHQYKVKQLVNTPNQKSVVATHIYYELIGNRKYDSFVGNRTFNEFATWLFNGTDWTFENVDVNYSLNINTFGNDNFIHLVQRLITLFDCEMQILQNRVVRFAQRIGRREDKQYRFKSNIQSISQSIDTSNVRTRIIANGANDLTVTYTSPLSQNPLFGLLDANPVSDNSITDMNELLQFARLSLNDVPEINLEVSVVDIDGLVGDYVFVIHEELNLEFETRILSKRTRRYYETSEVEIGNTKRITIEDAIVNQKQEVQENKELAKKDVDNLEEKTDRELATLTVGQNDIRLEVTNVENTLRSEIVQTANSIRLQVEEVDRSVSSLEITANQIQSNVTNLENNTNSSITQLSNNINLKVDVGGTISDINLSQGSATINADRINLNGAVLVNGSITGSTDITVNRNVAVGNAVYFGGYQGSFDFIEVSGGDMTFNSFGDFMFSGGNLYVNGRRVMTE